MAPRGERPPHRASPSSPQKESIDPNVEFPFEVPRRRLPRTARRSSHARACLTEGERGYQMSARTHGLSVQVNPRPAGKEKRGLTGMGCSALVSKKPI